MKFTAVVVLMVWIRWTLPRFRVDQVMRLCWLKLVPLCLVGLLGVALTMLVAGGTILGTPHGRVPALPRLDFSWLGRLLSWAVPLLLGTVLVAAARKKHGQVHPALRQLAGNP